VNELVYRFLRNDLSRRGFIQALTALGLTGTIAESTGRVVTSYAVFCLKTKTVTNNLMTICKSGLLLTVFFI